MSTLIKLLLNKPLTQDEKEIVGEVSFRHGKISSCGDEKIAKLEVENLILSKQVDRERAREFFYSLLD